MPEKKNKKINSEEPLIYKSGELLKKLIAKGKRQGFLKRDECENILEEATISGYKIISKKVLKEKNGWRTMVLLEYNLI